MCETEKASVNLKEKLDEAETAISLLRDEKATAACSIEKFAQDLEDALEQRTCVHGGLDGSPFARFLPAANFLLLSIGCGLGMEFHSLSLVPQVLIFRRLVYFIQGYQLDMNLLQVPHDPGLHFRNSAQGYSLVVFFLISP